MSNVTPQIMERGLLLGLKPDRIKFLMKISELPNYDAVVPNRPDSYTLFKPDENGVFYLKASISGRWVVKPLDRDEKVSKSMVPKRLKELGYNGK
jgi:hypothetical protein